MRPRIFFRAAGFMPGEPVIDEPKPLSMEPVEPSQELLDFAAALAPGPGEVFLGKPSVL